MFVQRFEPASVDALEMYIIIINIIIIVFTIIIFIMMIIFICYN